MLLCTSMACVTDIYVVSIAIGGFRKPLGSGVVGETDIE